MHSRRRQGGPVVCVACGDRVEREDTREYDPFGDRWDRDGKSFEFLCKPCHDLECHHPRDGLEAQLTTIGTDHADPAAFVRAFYDHLKRHEPNDVD